jgi:hypothetical protein
VKGELALDKTATEGIAGFTEGRIVHYVMPDGQHRPAILVRCWSEEAGCANLRVFSDGGNDIAANNGREIDWETSVLHSEGKEPRTWHFIEKVE